MHTTEAFIIKKEEYGEADLMLTALSERFGKIKVFAQGVRKQGAKLRGHCEPLSRTLVSFVEGRNGYRLIHADVREYYPAIRQDFEKLQVAYQCLALADKYLWEDRRGAGDFFALCENTFSFLEQCPGLTEVSQKKILFWFECNFLRLSGVLPEQGVEDVDNFGGASFQDMCALPLAEGMVAASAASAPTAGYFRTKEIFQKYLS